MFYKYKTICNTVRKKASFWQYTGATQKQYKSEKHYCVHRLKGCYQSYTDKQIRKESKLQMSRPVNYRTMYTGHSKKKKEYIYTLYIYTILYKYSSLCLIQFYKQGKPHHAQYRLLGCHELACPCTIS